MKKSIVISVLGNDSPGLVKSLSHLIVAHQGDWVESQMANLAGKFAGILRVDLPADQLKAFQAALQNDQSLGLSAIFEESGSNPIEEQTELEIALVGQDQLGIIHRISSALSLMNASVDKLHTEIIEAAMTGETLFKADIKIHIPSGVKENDIQEVLEELANELIVDIQLVHSDT
ncbi:glycine cleavage system protein R [Thiomicrorhabdus sp. Milos-T2]|uniref:glycine cleavage system protein R n=1 Tax=Thiomicrorhabdus sp. Milos-T2 TaxID=90814 RepID=UPI000493BCD7|nr:ACT domain-containing protein [Thiomicrorhabdus sp. Milos-T2]